MGFDLPIMPASAIMAEIAATVPAYGGITYARLERGGVNVPVASYSDPGAPILGASGDPKHSLKLTFVGAAD
jgi:formate dehydrogenase major subunit